MAWARWVALGCWALGSVTAIPALAAEPGVVSPPASQSTATAAPLTYALSWVRAEGAEECPNGHALAAEVERRLGRAVFDVAAERSLEVEVTRFGAIYRSDVYVRDVTGHAVGHRQLQSDEPGCSALVNATALAIALVIDPDAASRPPAPPKAAAAFDLPPPAPPLPATAVAAPPPPPVAPPQALPEKRLPEPPRTPITLSGRGEVLGGVVPAISPGFELSFSARPSTRFGYAVAASLALSQTATFGIGSLDVGLTRASALVTFDAGRSERVRLVLAAGPTLGVFHVAVRAPAPVTDSGDFSFWGGELAADLQISVTNGFFCELGGAALLPLRRQEFLVRGQSGSIWRQPFFSGLGFVGLGTKFP